MKGRRKSLASAGALAAINTVGTVSASNQTEELSKEIINKEVLEGAEENGITGAEQALEDLGLDPNFNTKHLEESDLQERENDGELSSEWVFSDPEEDSAASFSCTSSSADNDDEVYITALSILRNPTYTARNSWWAPDAIAIGYNDSDWGAMGHPDISATGGHSARYTSDDVADDALARYC